MEFWTITHLLTIIPSFIIMIFISLIMRYFLINKPLEKRMIPIKIISVIIIIIEIGKQIYSISIGYNLYHIPLHFCSIFLYVLPLMAFYKGKHLDHVRSLACSTMTALLIGMLIIPSVIYSESRIKSFFTDYLSFHTVFFHNLVIFSLFITYFLDLHKPNGTKQETCFISLFGLGFVVLAATFSHILQTNFSNFLYTTVGFMNDLVIRLKEIYGTTIINIIYTISISILHILLMILTNYIYLLICKLKPVKSNK